MENDRVNIIYNKKSFSFTLKNIIYQGNVVDKLKFMEEFMAILKKEKIKGKFFGDDIYVVLNSYYTVSDKYFLESIFLEMGFLNVKWIPIEDLLPEENATYIEVNDTYMVVNLDAGVFVDLNYFKDMPTVLAQFYQNYKEDIVLFGNNKNIPYIKIKNKNVYYFENYANYIVESLLKVKKCGA